MLPRARRRASLLAFVVALLAALLTTVPGPAAQAADDQALVNGAIRFPQHDRPPLKMLWFDEVGGQWHYLGQRNLGRTNGYSMWLAPGTYHLQFVDQRPAYDVGKYAPTDIQVTVRANDITTRAVTLWPGAAITGTAKAGGKPLAGARVVAANKGQQSFTTTANSRGQFAIGGLPRGQYSVFTYDRRKEWAGKSAWAGTVLPGRPKNLAIGLTERAGSMTVYLFTPEGRLRATTPVTITSRKTGQWWTATARNGTAVFKGLYPGGYTLKFDGAGVWFARTGSVERATVRSGQMAFGKFDITQRGGWVTGTVVDGGDPTTTMANAQVRLLDANENVVASTVADADGFFELTGRLATQDGMTVVVDPKADSGGWMQGGLWCKFAQGSLAPVEVVTGEETYVGDVELPRSTDKDQPQQCRPAPRAGRR
ncbi:carboxypeptidase-like regulatory domain-containing protein [Nocardioides sp.]|uniref:MSCRAMM family protein n=1 Tax=Nocardioides sp. TaxID=35761 RepID=UPI002EDAFE5E